MVKQYAENSGITSQARTSNLYDRKMTNRQDKRLLHFQFELPNACNGNLFGYARKYLKYVCPQKSTWCIAAIERCLEGGVVNAIERG